MEERNLPRPEQPDRRQAQIGHGIRSGATPDEGGTVHVIWGAVMDDVEVAGMTVGEAMAELQGPYNIAPGVRVTVNGDDVDGDTRLSAGDTLEFVRAAGEKGASSPVWGLAAASYARITPARCSALIGSARRGAGRQSDPSAGAEATAV